MSTSPYRTAADLTARDIGSHVTFQPEPMITVDGILDKVHFQRGWKGEGLGRIFIVVDGGGGHRWSGHVDPEALVSTPNDQ